MSNYAVIAASNDEKVLRSSLLASPDLQQDVEISVQRNAPSSAVAYNRGIAETNAEIMLFAHQDLFLPDGWMKKFQAALGHLSQIDPNWGVLGLFGTDRKGCGHGHVYSTGIRAVVGSAFNGTREVDALDEVLLVLRRSSGLRFDERMAGFHLYGGDICAQAQERGMKCHAMSAFAIHNSNGIGVLPLDYWKVYLQMRRKWWSRLPLRTPCMPVTRWCGPAIQYLLGHPLWLLRQNKPQGRRVPDPVAVWRQLQEQGMVGQRA